jgi:predicted P-loop ATPase
MNLKYDYNLEIATAHSRTSKTWHNRLWKWSELVERCSTTQRTGETAAEYAKLPKDEQSQIKDVGGFVGGYLNKGTRKKGSVLFRTIATLDIDFGTTEVWDDFTMAFSCAAMLYSTHKHSDATPRYRLVLPLSRQVKPDEYEPLCRKIAAEIGIDLFDDTTYELPRLFYWPSTSKDAEYVFKVQDGPAINVDKILAQYTDYRDVSAWPMSSRQSTIIAHEIRKAGDPTEKPGIIGAFCRAYTIEDAITKFLSEYYEPTATEGRYTYKKGSVAGGLVCYESKYAYSHHDTDPAGHQLCNAFDLVRIHLYGIKDEGCRQETDITKRPSYLAMQEFAAADEETRVLLARERRQSVAEDFGGVEVEAPEGYSDEWAKGLECTKNGAIKPTTGNIALILNNDPALAGKIWHDDFGDQEVVVDGLPWNKKATIWTDEDDANLRVWLETNYGITGQAKIKDALCAVLTKNRFHPVQQYLSGLTWDKVERLDRLIIDYIGANDTEINRAFTRKQFVAAVARVFAPGCKYDQCLIMCGPEGCGKSTLLNVMGGKWFNDSIITMEGKDGMEQLRGSWIIELGELNSIKKSDVEQVKAYLSRQSDIYRKAYGVRTAAHPRQCIFFGTTNEDKFLKGDSGNRRFWVIPVTGVHKYPDWYTRIAEERDQIWAEAMHYYRAGESLCLSPELEKAAKVLQKEYNDDADDPTRDLLYHFLDVPLPTDWAVTGLAERRRYFVELDEMTPTDGRRGTERRTKFSAIEFICERLGKNPGDKDIKYLTKTINKLMDELPDWQRITSTRHTSNLYGVQRGYRRKEDNTGDEI